MACGEADELQKKHQRSTLPGPSSQCCTFAQCLGVHRLAQHSGPFKQPATAEGPAVLIVNASSNWLHAAYKSMVQLQRHVRQDQLLLHMLVL